MASKAPRSKIDHESRAKLQKELNCSGVAGDLPLALWIVNHAMVWQENVPIMDIYGVSFNLLEKYLEAHSKASMWENELLDVGYQPLCIQILYTMAYSK
ncbi:uncharacterized protein HKW66_Vig0172480 [Vigna angularis]|uniref:Uncharacterized protein n=1 Tax=Phaseolus angularis TaxID=3914 RepID=A0A8T0JUB9_PHAAN|nr:uncharacterized protein HKW66_Vig0172480 [Vigna angularis]